MIDPDLCVGEIEAALSNVVSPPTSAWAPDLRRSAGTFPGSPTTFGEASDLRGLGGLRLW